MMPVWLMPSPSIRVEPMRLLGMFLWGIVCGGGLGVLWDAFRITRIAMGLTAPTHAIAVCSLRPLPLLHRPLRFSAPQERRHPVAQAIVFVEDVLFGIACGVVLTLLVYVTGDGIPRVMAPAGMLLGFVLYYRTVGRLLLMLSGWILFLLRAVLCYIAALCLLPPRLLVRLWRCTLGVLICRTVSRAREKRTEQYHQAMLRAMTVYAAKGFLGDAPEKLKKGGWNHVKSKTGQKDDNRIAQYANFSSADRALCHYLFCNQADGEQQATPRARRPARGDRRSAAKGV